MTPEAQRIAIAEACGWTVVSRNPLLGVFSGMRGGPAELPDYLTDLNAMHEAEKVTLVKWDDPANAGHYIWKDTYGVYIGWLAQITNSLYFRPKADSTEFAKLISATAAKRAEAFLRTLNLWKSSPLSPTQLTHENT